MAAYHENEKAKKAKTSSGKKGKSGGKGGKAKSSVMKKNTLDNDANDIDDDLEDESSNNNQDEEGSTVKFTAGQKAKIRRANAQADAALERAAQGFYLKCSKDVCFFHKCE